MTTPNSNPEKEGHSSPLTGSANLRPEDIEGTPEEIIKRLAGRELPPTNGWGRGVVVGAWKLRRTGEEAHVRLLLACPNAENPVQLFNEDARDYLPNRLLGFGDALRIARGCLDYGGGHRSDEGHLEIYHHGIQTVINALEAAEKNGLADTQCAALWRMGQEKPNDKLSDREGGAS